MKKRLLSAALCLCMLLTLLPTVAFADGGNEQMGYSTAILHDESGTYQDDELYDAGSYQLDASMETGGYSVSATNLKQHQNGQNTMGYWAGVAVTAPANATQMKVAMSTDAAPSLKDVPATALEERVFVDEEGTAYNGVAFYADTANVTTLYCAVQWLDGNGNVVTSTNETGINEVYSFTVDFSGVTHYVVPAEGSVASIGSVGYGSLSAAIAEEEIVSTLPFSDVGVDDWFYEAVQYVYENGMMNGVGNNLFAPSSNLTRGMIAQVLYNLESTPAAGNGVFTDVAANQWYADAVNWAAANDIVGGYGNGKFGPEDDITREQMAQILYNYAIFKGYDVSVQGGLSTFNDGAKTSDWALSAMKWAVGSGLLQGYNGNLNPTGTATRAEVAQILMNFCENIAK